MSRLVHLRISSYNSHSLAHLHDLRSFRQAPARQSLSEGSGARRFRFPRQAGKPIISAIGHLLSLEQRYLYQAQLSEITE